MIIRLVAASMFMCLMGSVGFSQEAKGDPREKLETLIPAVIELLEAKDYESLLTKYVSPMDLERILKSLTIEELVKNFGGKKAERLLAAFNEIKGTEPKLDPGGEKATFELKKPIGTKRTVTFQKVGKYWYIGY